MPEVSRKIEKSQIGVEITNAAHFPISVLLTAASTSIGGVTPPRAVFPKGPGIVGPYNKIRVLDDAMEMDGVPCQRLSGQMDLTIKYGKPGKEKFELNPRGIVDIVMTDFGFVSSVTLGFVAETLNLQPALPSSQTTRKS
jgi:hypothetical protein